VLHTHTDPQNLNPNPADRICPQVYHVLSRERRERRETAWTKLRGRDIDTRHPQHRGRVDVGKAAQRWFADARKIRHNVRAVEISRRRHVFIPRTDGLEASCRR
jgi:hypothetical protein